MRSPRLKPALLALIVLTGIFFLGASIPNPGPEIEKKVAAVGTIRTVVIDAGHGGKDPGCHGLEKNYKEKDVALGIALKLGKYIETHFKDVKVVYTRKTDVFVELNERANIANRNNGDLFICIHCNSACYRDKKTRKDVCNEEAHGAETYVMGLHKSAGNLAVAKRENQAILLEDDYKTKYDGFDPNSDEGHILMVMTQNAYMDRSLNFAAQIQKEFRERAGRKDKGVKQAGFLVLWKTKMPSVLIETGFLTNKMDEKFLGSEKGQDYMASAIFRAFRAYKNEVEGNNIQYSDDIEKQSPYVEDSSENPEAPAVSDGNPKKEDRKPEPVIPGDPNPADKKDTGEKEKKDPENKGIPADVLTFRVQFYLSSTRVPEGSDKFKGLPEINEYMDKGNYKYTSGVYLSMEEASKNLSLVRSRGFSDAFIVQFRDGKRIK